MAAGRVGLPGTAPYPGQYAKDISEVVKEFESKYDGKLLGENATAVRDAVWRLGLFTEESSVLKNNISY